MWLPLRSLRPLVLAAVIPACSFGAPTADGPAGHPDAERTPVVYHPDGTVEVDEERFESVEAFHRSDDFRDQGRRCATQETPELAAIDASDCSYGRTRILPDYAPGATLTIPVVFHVIQRSNGQGRISEALLRSQVDVLNEDFDALAGSLGADGVESRIRFALATTKPDGSPTNGIEYVTDDDWFTDPGPGRTNAMKRALAWNPRRYLNIYTNDAAGSLGYATFPSQSAGQPEDGVVLLWTSVGRDAPLGGEYDQGRTATHEVGHYLGLFHTFQDGCGSSASPYTSGDRIADTVAHSSPDYECVARASTCGGGGMVPVDNYMDYPPDACMTGFTAEQVNRMRCSLANYRAELPTAAGGGGGGGGEEPEGELVEHPGLSGAQGSERRFTFTVPSGATGASFSIAGGGGDADLYLRRGAPPTTSTWHYRPYLDGNDETVDVPAQVAPGTWHVLVRGYSPYSGVTLRMQWQ